MELNLKGKTVVITGGATGIGKAAAMEFLREGCNVVVCGRRLEKLEAAAAEASEICGERFMTGQADVTDEASLSAFAESVAGRFGKIDVWINNAGANKIQSLMDYTVEDFRAMTDLLLVSVFSGCRIAAGHMRKTGGGVILNASSFAAVIPNAGRAPYSACKAAVSSLTRSFAAELARDQIRVVSYIPGLVVTDINRANVEKNGEALLESIPVRRFGTPEDLSKVLVFLASDAASYINGVDIAITGGKFAVQNNQYSW